MSFIGPEAIIKKRKEYFYPATHSFYKKPPQLVKGKAQYLYDTEGKQYVDFFAGVSVLNAGHCNDEILKKTIEQLETLQHTSTIYLTQPNVDLAEKLAAILPGDIKRTFFCSTGSEANEGALLLARMHTKKKNFIALEGGLHGRTSLTMAVTGIPMWRTDDFLEDCVHFIPRPYDPKLSGKIAAMVSLEALEEVLSKHGDNIAAMIAEPIQGNGGITTPVDSYFKKVKALLEQYGVLLIIDEIQTGYGRTGKMFGIEHYDVIPDIIVTAKALGNGVPISTFSTTDEIAESFNKPSASTLGGNLVSSSTAIAVLDYIQENDLVQKSEQLGRLLREKLDPLKDKYPFVTDVRGKGLMQGVQIIDQYYDISGDYIVDVILESMKNQGFLIGKNGLGRDVLAFQPPLVISEENIVDMVQALDIELEKINKTFEGLNP